MTEGHPERQGRVDVGVGVVGCGFVSREYLETLRLFGVGVAGCFDTEPERACELAAEFGIERTSTLDELLGDPGVDLVLNLTPPQVHGLVTRRSLVSGKSVYSEKPMAPTAVEAWELARLAASSGVALACAPDIFLGSRLQDVRRLVEAGAIGEPVGALATCLGPGYEGWHPRPSSFYCAGAGPLFDMGPYWLTPLVHIFGPAAVVTGLAGKVSRTGRRDRGGEAFPVAVPTHVGAMISFRSGPTAVLTTSFEVWATRVPSLELYGTEGTISLQEPLYSFEGVTRIRRSGTDAWEERHATPALPSERRGVGVIEMLEARARGEPPRAAADVAAHIVEVMEACLHSSEGGRWIDIDSSCAVPPPLPLDGLAARSVHLS